MASGLCACGPLGGWDNMCVWGGGVGGWLGGTL